MKSLLLNKLLTILVICTMGTVGHVLIKKGLNKIGQFGLNDIFSNFGTILTNGHIMSALLIYGVGIFIYFSLLSRTQLSTLYPIAVGIDFALLALVSHVMLGEALSLFKIAGLILIFMGIGFFSFTGI